MYTVVSGNDYSYPISDDDQIIQTCKYYEFEHIQIAETFVTESRNPDPTMTNKQCQNRNQLDALSTISEHENNKTYDI